MSAQSTKKKRIGSRRWVANQNKTSEADEFHVTDSSSVVQHSTPGENTESLNILANPDYSKSETQNPPSPELSKHRKKLGSSRRNKGERHGKDSATESYDKPREEVEEKTRGNETQMSLTIQPQQQEELSQRTEDDTSARHDSSLYSTITPDYFSEVQYSTGSNNPETDQESLISKSQNLQANQDEHDADYKVVSDSCTLVETMLEGTHKSDTVQKEELTENAHLVEISEVTSLNLPTGPTVDQQLIDQSSSTEIAGDERYNVNSVTEKESKERHEGTYLLGQDGNLQGNDLESDSHVKSVVTEFSTTPEITTDQSSPSTNTELECSVEQAIFSSPNEHLNLHQVNSAQHSQDAINKECEQEFKPTERCELNHSSSVTHVTEDAEVISGNVVDQAEIGDTQQSELIVKSMDDFATRQLDSNPDDEHDVHPTRENNFDTLKQTHEDDLYDTEIPQINLMSESHLMSDDIEFSTESKITTDDSRTREHTEPECSTEQAMLSSPKDGFPKNEVECVHHLEDAVNKVHEQEVKPTQKHEMDHYSDYDEHDKRETDFKVEVSDKSVGAPLEEIEKSDTLQSECSLQTQLSETNVPLDSQPQQNDKDSIGSRRKLGSTRRNKGRHRVKESVAESYLRPTEEVVESVSDNEALETTQMLVAIEKTNQEESSPESCDVIVPATDDNSLYSAIMSDYSSEVQNSNTTNYPETDMESLSPKRENLQEDHDEEVKTTHELDHSSESLTQVATEDAEIISGNLIDQAEISDTYQSEFIVKGTDDSSIKQEDLNPVDTHDVHPTKENSIETLEQTNEDYHVYDTEKLQISDTERVDSTLGHVYEGESKVVEDDIIPSAEQTVNQEKEGKLSGDEENESSLQTQQSETIAPLDSQPQQNDTDFNSIGNRRKLGSSRRNKGRHRVKESVAESYLRPTEEVVESVSDNEALETTQMLVAIEKTNQEESSPESCDVIVPATDDNSLYSAIMSDYPSEVQNSNTTKYPETDMESLIPKSENLQEDHDEEVKTTHELDHSSESVTQVATEDAEIISGNLIDQAEISDTYQFEFIVKGTDDSSVKQEDLHPVDTQDVHPTKENSIEALEQTNEDEDTKKLQISDTERVDSALGHLYEGEASVVEDDIKPSVEQTVHQEKEGLNSEVEESESSLQTLQSGTNATLDSQLEQNGTNFNSIGSRRKLGSSRRNRGRRHAKDPVAESNDSPTEEVVRNIRDNAQTEGSSDQVKENEHVGALVGISEFISSRLHPNLTVDQQVIDLSNSTEMPEQDLSNVYSVKEKESKDGDEDTDLLRLDGNSQGNYLVSESHLKLSDIESTTPEISTEKSSTGEHADIECVKQAAFSSPNEKLSTNEEQQEHVNISQVRGSLHSENVLNEVHEEVVEPIQMQEMHHIDFSSINESLQSEMNALLNSQDNSQDNSVRMEEETDFNPTRHRRKLGSSRRNKGQQQVKVSVAKTYHEPKDEFVENARGDEALETTKMLLATDTTGQEEFKQQTNLDLKPVKNEENTEKMLEDTILSQNVMDISTMGTKDITSSSGKDDSVESNKDVKEPENVSQFTGNNTVKIDLMQSPEDDSYIHNISNHDDSVTTRPVTTDVLEQEEAYLVQNREALSNFEDPTEKDHEAQEINISQGITHAELFSAAQTNIGTLAPFDIGLMENRAETAMDVPEESGISCNQQQGIQEKIDLDNSENLQGKTKQKRRKMGSTRRTQLNREPEEGMGNEDGNKESDSNMVDMKCFDKMEVVELPVIVTADVHQNENTKPSLSPVDTEQQGTSVISTVQDLPLTVLPPVDPTKENNFEALEQTNEEQQISGIERVDTALGQVYVIEEEDDIKPSAEQTVHQKKEGLFSEVEESDSSLQTLQSGTNATLDSTLVQNDTNFNPIGSRRKLGSSRRNKGRQHAKDSEQQEINEISTVQDLALTALPPEQSTVDVEPSQLDDFTSTEIHVPSMLARTNTTNTGITGGSFVSSYETTQSAQNDEERPESVNLIQDQALQSAEAPVVADLEMMKSIVRGGAEDEHKDDQANIQELNDVNEGAHNTDLEMKNSSPNLNSPVRRRKMGSTRRNLGSRSKREDLHQQQELENEATETVTNVGGVKSASFQSIEEKEELQPLTEDKEIDSEQRKEKVFETVEYSHAFVSHVKPLPHQEIEENPVSHVQPVETDHQLTPSDLPAIPSTSPTAGGRRRKLGSSRKSRGHQTERGDRITDTQNSRDVRSITEESDIKMTEEDSLGLDKISEVDESDKKPPSNISASKAEEHSRPVSERTPQQVTPVLSSYAEIRLSQDSQKSFPLAGSHKGAALTSNSYNVMMVGDSCVGKSSFMKRAQSGKFSLDVPASVGLDSCTWTVVVDGKPVVLQLWDTAGQERFHSITRQIFYKAQAFLLMYDITSAQSFSAVSYWANCIQEGAAENVTVLLLGNKNDRAERKVKTQEGANLAREYNFEFMECSAATGENVIHSLETVARMLSQKVDTRVETTVLKKEPQQKKSGCC